jgi:hypothetical protein
VSGWLLDTNVLSELRRPQPEPKVMAFVGGQALVRQQRSLRHRNPAPPHPTHRTQ